MTNKENGKPSNDENDNDTHEELVDEMQDASESMANKDSDSDSSDDMKKQMEKLQSDILYLKADFENYKKRMIKERSEVIKYGSESLIVSLLDVLDNFERAMSVEVNSENIQSFSEGIKMISNEFKNVLNRFGVSEIKALGENFDPTNHEAMGTEPTSDHKPGTISKVFTKPYKLHDRVIRPGKVIIAEEPKGDNKTEQ